MSDAKQVHGFPDQSLTEPQNQELNQSSPSTLVSDPCFKRRKIVSLLKPLISQHNSQMDSNSKQNDINMP